MAGGRLPACKKEGFRRAQGDSAVERPSRAKSKTNNTGDSHVVTHRSTNPAITCLYMAERTGCLAFTYLWSFVLEQEVYRLIYLTHPPSQAAEAPLHALYCPSQSFRGRPYRLPRTRNSQRHAAPARSYVGAATHFRHVSTSGGDPAVHCGHADAELQGSFHLPTINSSVQYTRLQVRAD